MFLGLLDVSNSFLSVLDVSTQTITAVGDGGLANTSRRMVALLHIVQGACMGRSFSLCWCERLWAACILRCRSNGLLGVLDVNAGGGGADFAVTVMQWVMMMLQVMLMLVSWMKERFQPWPWSES